MHFELTNIVQTLLKGNPHVDSHTPTKDTDDHEYIRGDIETRGPCPGLNALANQGYL